MTGIFISHSTKDEKFIKEFASRFLIFECNVAPKTIFNTFYGEYVPGGKMMYSRIFSALYDCEIMIIIASKNYFKSNNCLLELGASISPERKNVYYFLTPGMSIEDVPSEFSWFPWRYLDDNIELDNIKKEIKQSIHIDLFNTRYKYSEPIYSYEDFIKNKYGIIHLIKRVLVYPCKKILMSDKDKLNFKNYVYRLYLYPKIISSKPFRGDYGKKDAVFGLMIYENLKMEYIPIIFAAHDQISLMNADSLIESIKSHSKSRIVVGLWPDKEFGVTIQEGIGGGTRRKQDKQVEEEYGLDNIIYETRGANMDHDSDGPHWFDEWCARNNL